MEKSKKTHHKRKKSDGEGVYTKIYIILAISLVVFAAYNTIQTANMKSEYEKQIKEIKEATKPAEIEIMTITNPDCEECYSPDRIVNGIKRQNVKLKGEKKIEFLSDEAQSLIKRYGIEKIPAVIVKGEIEKIKAGKFEKTEDALVFKEPSLPYTDTKTGKVKGLVTVTIITNAQCAECADINRFVSSIKESGISIASEKNLDMEFAEAQALIKKYNIEVLPVAIFSSDLKDYNSDLVSNWNSIGTVEEDGSYVTRFRNPPYFNVTSNKVEGLVSAIYLIDSQCEKCYDPKAVHQPILANRFGMKFSSEETVDVSSEEGKALVEKYGIEKVPTVILKGDVGLYKSLTAIWSNVGTVEDDGTLVFRQVEFNGQPYKNLKTGETVEQANG